MDVNRDPLAPFQAGQTQGSSGLEVSYLMHPNSQQIVTLSAFILSLLTKPHCHSFTRLYRSQQQGADGNRWRCYKCIFNSSQTTHLSSKQINKITSHLPWSSLSTGFHIKGKKLQTCLALNQKHAEEEEGRQLQSPPFPVPLETFSFLQPWTHARMTPDPVDGRACVVSQLPKPSSDGFGASKMPLQHRLLAIQCKTAYMVEEGAVSRHNLRTIPPPHQLQIQLNWDLQPWTQQEGLHFYGVNVPLRVRTCSFDSRKMKV